MILKEDTYALMRRAVWAVRELALVAALISNASAKVSEGNLRTKNDWSFLEKFAFDNTGNSEVWIDVKANRGPETRILLYNDKENEWPQVSLLCAVFATQRPASVDSRQFWGAGVWIHATVS